MLVAGIKPQKTKKGRKWYLFISNRAVRLKKKPSGRASGCCVNPSWQNQSGLYATKPQLFGKKLVQIKILAVELDQFIPIYRADFRAEPFNKLFGESVGDIAFLFVKSFIVVFCFVAYWFNNLGVKIFIFTNHVPKVLTDHLQITPDKARLGFTITNTQHGLDINPSERLSNPCYGILKVLFEFGLLRTIPPIGPRFYRNNIVDPFVKKF